MLQRSRFRPPARLPISITASSLYRRAMINAVALTATIFSRASKSGTPLLALFYGSRAFLVDEPTSALDPKTELQFQDALDKTRGEMTIIAIAHRLHTIRKADRIFLVHDGHRSDHGTTMNFFNEVHLTMQMLYINSYRTKLLMSTELPSRTLLLRNTKSQTRKQQMTHNSKFWIT